MWLFELMEIFQLRHNVISTGKMKAFYVEMSLNCNILAPIIKNFPWGYAPNPLVSACFASWSTSPPVRD